MVKYKVGNSNYIDEDEFFARLEKAIEIENNNRNGTRYDKRTMKDCKSDLKYRGYCELYLVKEMYSPCPFFMADENVFAIFEIIDKNFTCIDGDLEGVYAFSIARTLFKNGCRIERGINDGNI